MADEVIKEVDVEEIEMNLCVTFDNPELVFVGVDFYGELTKADLRSIAKQLIEFTEN